MTVDVVACRVVVRQMTEWLICTCDAVCFVLPTRTITLSITSLCRVHTFARCAQKPVTHTWGAVELIGTIEAVVVIPHTVPGMFGTEGLTHVDCESSSIAAEA